MYLVHQINLNLENHLQISQKIVSSAKGEKPTKHLATTIGVMLPAIKDNQTAV